MLFSSTKKAEPANDLNPLEFDFELRQRPKWLQIEAQLNLQHS